MCEIERLREALEKIDAIRNSIIGCQKVNWSEHVYPLVAALGEAGYPGQEYEAARENVGTLIEQIKAAEAENARLRAALASTPPGAERGEWMLVPVEPTREMWAASGDAVINLQHRDIGHHDQFSEAVWRAMLKAAPPSPPDAPG